MYVFQMSINVVVVGGLIFPAFAVKSLRIFTLYRDLVKVHNRTFFWLPFAGLKFSYWTQALRSQLDGIAKQWIYCTSPVCRGVLFFLVFQCLLFIFVSIQLGVLIIALFLGVVPDDS